VTKLTLALIFSLMSLSAFAAETDKRLHEELRAVTGDEWFADIEISDLKCTKSKGLLGSSYACDIRNVYSFGYSSFSLKGGSRPKKIYQLLEKLVNPVGNVIDVKNLHCVFEGNGRDDAEGYLCSL